MDANIVDLRYKMNQVLEALSNRETVNVLYHGKLKGIIHPVQQPKLKVQDHEFFGAAAKTKRTVAEEMKILRGGRYHDL